MLSFLKKLLPGSKSPVSNSSYKNGYEKPPSKSQREECEYLGLTIKPKMTSHDVWRMINDAVENPKYKALQDAYIAEKNSPFEQEDRGEYGDALVDELNKWEKICYPDQYLVTYKKGKTLRSDIVEFERAYIEDAQKPYVKIEALLPKIRKPKNDEPSIEWEKETTFRPKQILDCKKLPQEIDMFDVAKYEQILAAAKETEAKFML
ncbi:MAG: hypothetical protein KAT62_04870 [Desulfuromonadales bacterium]|nr:hypothetical protein [Desulfuromonadales bacterium]